jgi:hypothetical protein
MKMSNLFPSKYLKASDIEGSATFKIKSVDVEKMGDGEVKPVLSFVGQDKALVMNKTNGNVLVSLYGDDTDEWTGQKIQLVATTTEFGGRVVDCVRLRPVPASDELKKAEFD